jgi:hypothetical protein
MSTLCFAMDFGFDLNNDSFTRESNFALVSAFI